MSAPVQLASWGLTGAGYALAALGWSVLPLWLDGRAREAGETAETISEDEDMAA